MTPGEYKNGGADLNIATSLESPRASLAVGTAIASNPFAYLIPCHRVIRATGVLGGYHWGLILKHAILGWEASHAK